jgi:hypothetical protein
VPWVSMLYGFNYIMNCDSEFYLFLAFLFSFLTINCDLLHVSPWERLILQQYFKREKTDTNINFLFCSIATFYILTQRISANKVIGEWCRLNDQQLFTFSTEYALYYYSSMVSVSRGPTPLWRSI